MPGATVQALAEDAAAGAAEQPPVGRGLGGGQVPARQRDQNRRGRNDPDRAVGAVLEATLLVRRAGAGPGRSGAGAGAGKDQLARPRGGRRRSSPRPSGPRWNSPSRGTRIADVGGGVTDEAWANVAKHYDDDQLADLVCLIGLINAYNRMNVIAQQPAGDYQPGQRE